MVGEAYATCLMAPLASLVAHRRPRLLAEPPPVYAPPGAVPCSPGGPAVDALPAIVVTAQLGVRFFLATLARCVCSAMVLGGVPRRAVGCWGPCAAPRLGCGVCCAAEWCRLVVK